MKVKKILVQIKTLAAALLLLTLIPVSVAQADTLTVNTTADNTTAGDTFCTLREAISNANGDSDTTSGDCTPGNGIDTIMFDSSLAGSTITLSNTANSTWLASALSISSEIVIDGTDAEMLTIAGDGSRRLFYIPSGGNLTLKNITLSGGVAQGGNGGQRAGGTGGGGAGMGGAIFNEGTVDIEGVTLRDNQALGGNGGTQAAGSTAGSSGGGPNGGSGGAFGGGNGTAGGFGGGGGGGGNCWQCAAGNGGNGGFGGGSGGGGGLSSGGAGSVGSPGTPGFGGGAGASGTSNYGGRGGGGAGLGGAIFNHGGTVTINNSTFSNNTANGGSGSASGSGYGAAIFNRNGTVTVLYTTFSANTADGGGGIYNLGDGAAGSTTVDNSILANTVGGNDFTGNTINSGANTTLGSQNIIEGSSGFAGGVTSTADPTLLALADNGGPTLTYALNAGSPAINVIPTTDGNCNPGTTVDQRGGVRANGTDRGETACEIGAVEYNSIQNPTAITLKNFSARASDASLLTGGFLASLAAIGGIFWRRKTVKGGK